MEVIYVCYRYRDYRKENDASIIGVYKTLDSASSSLCASVLNYCKENDFPEDQVEYEKDSCGNLYCTIEQGSDCEIFCLEKKTVLD